MSVRDFFKKNEVSKVLSNATLDSISSEAGSEEIVHEKLYQNQRFIPWVDYSDPANFAHYGSAEKYYLDAINRILTNYPFDGSLREKLQFENSSSHLDNWVFNNVYPRVNGHIRLSANGWGSTNDIQARYGSPTRQEYIQVRGGPHSASVGMDGKSLYSVFDDANVFSSGSGRTSNLSFDLEHGNTIEFVLKKSDFDITKTEKEVIFDLWNGEDSGSSGYGRLTLELSGTATANQSPFILTVQSGTQTSVNGFFSQRIGDTQVTTASLDSWHQYAVSVINSGSGILVELYSDGNPVYDTTVGTSIQEVSGALIANIGALRTAPSGVIGPDLGWGKFSGSLDEFRFWKTRRTPAQINKYWNTDVYGGTNVENSNIDLGVYYKFNEGITGDDNIDKKVLDYSGRISNGQWVGYTGNSRRITSAFVEGNLAETEFKDPILYDIHPDIQALKEGLSLSGSAYDQNNNAALYFSMPQWIIEEDTDQKLFELTQIIGSYFDTLFLQIEALPSLQDNVYVSASFSAPPFADKLLKSVGFTTPEIFADADVLAVFENRDQNQNFELDLAEVKNRIYQNIYNNLGYILKSKGTEKSFRNLIRCFGIDDELIHLNIYSNNDEYELSNRYAYKAIKRKVIDFNHADRFQGTIYQWATSDANTRSFISGSQGDDLEDYIGFTAEASVIFPKKLDSDNPAASSSLYYSDFAYITSSIFGMHTADPENGSSLTWYGSDPANFQVYALRPEVGSNDAYFVLKSIGPVPFPELKTDLYKNVFDNERWQFAVSMRPNKYPLAESVTGTLTTKSINDSEDTRFEVEFYGVNTVLDVVQNEFILNSTVTSSLGKNFMHSAKRLYAGAHRTNFNGGLIEYSNVKLDSVRYWATYLTSSIVRAHALDPENYGHESPSRSEFLLQQSLTGTQVPAIDTLVLNWDFSQVTGADGGTVGSLVSDAKFYVADVSSGSLELQDRYFWYGKLAKAQHPGQGDFFLPNDQNVVDLLYVQAAKQQLPETITAADTINILRQDDNVFTKQTTFQNYYFSIEASPYRAVSEEILNMFATIIDFNNLIGDPVNRYRQEYKSLGKLRQLFFERVKSEPSVDRYIEYYKWVDGALGKMLGQLIPVSAEFSDAGIHNVVESHILERNKYQVKYPTLELKNDIPEAGIENTTKLLPWQFDHKPIGGEESLGSLWWKYRASRTEEPALSSSVESANDSRVMIFEAGASALNRSYTTPLKASIERVKSIHGGTNYSPSKNRQNVLLATAPGGPMDGDAHISVPQNIMMVFGADMPELVDVNDEFTPSELRKLKYNPKVLQGRDYSDNYAGVGTGERLLPFNIMSGSYPGMQQIEGFKTNAFIANLHSDTTTLDNEIPMQGPFTEKWVGGHQSRHVKVNLLGGTGEVLDDAPSRPEAWYILTSKCDAEAGPTDVGQTLGIVGADYPWPESNDQAPYYPVRQNAKAVYYRDGFAKRPYNTQNIKHNTGSAATVLGNYATTREFLQVTGRGSYNKEFVRNEGITASLTETYNILRTNIRNDDFRVNNPVPQRERSESVIVSRFSSPGDPRTMNPGYMDLAKEEYSVYNALPWRNLQVLGGAGTSTSSSLGFNQKNDGGANSHPQREGIGLNQLLSEHAGKFGIDVNSSVRARDYTTPGAFHGTNRNPHRANVFVDSQNLTIRDKDVFDNWYIQHTIPAKDTGYAWISASIDTLQPQPLNFATSSVHLQFKDKSTESGSHSFVRIGHYINDPIADRSWGEAENYLGYNPSSNPVSTYAGSTPKTLSDPEVLNFLLLQRNGPYQYPTWKQIRGQEHPVVQYWRKNNTVSIVEEPSKEITVKTTINGVDSSFKVRSQTGDVKYFREPAVLNKSYPISHTLKMKDNSGKTRTVYLKSSFSNNNRFWANSELDGLTQVSASSGQGYHKITDLYLNGNIDKTSSPVDSFVSMKYKETVFPAETSVASSSVRTRENFSNSFWRDLRIDRNSVKRVNSQNFRTNQSSWALEEGNDFITGSTPSFTQDTEYQGELQSANTWVHGLNTSNAISTITGSAVFYHRHTIGSTGSLVSPSGIEIPSTASHTTESSTAPIGEINLFGGEASWEAGEQAGVISDGEFVSGTQTPWYGSYNQYSADLKATAKDYAIIPEFRISEHIPFYVTGANKNFLADNPSMFSVAGTEINSSRNSFYKIYTNSDFMKDFSDIRTSHKDFVDASKISLTCKAVAKFVPYDGFYPMSRTLQMAQQFSSSYAPHVIFEGKDTAADNTAMRTFLTPFYAPGIMYNTIKSGMAVDYPVLTASFSKQRLVVGNSNPASATDNTLTQYYGIGFADEDGTAYTRWDTKVPFETLVEPEKYITNLSIVDLEPHPSCSLNVTASWDGQGDDLYKLMASNFFAETAEFFLKDQSFTSLRSKPENELNLNLQSGSWYGARVRMRRSMNKARGVIGGSTGFPKPQDHVPDGDLHETFTMYSRPTAFGPPVFGATHALSRNNGPEANSNIKPQDSTRGFNWSYTPPYYHGEAWLDMIFDVPLDGTYALKDIINGLKIRAWRAHDGANEISGSTSLPYGPGNVDANAMQLTSSMNVKGLITVPATEYYPNGQVKSFKSDSGEKTNQWSLQMKYETPMLNFNSAGARIPTYASESVPRGIWHQFGLLPTDPKEGIFVSVEDIPKSWLKNNSQVSDVGEIYGGSGAAARIGSLADLVGFDTKPVRVGEVANVKSFKEAVVAVPFVEVNGERKFFELNPETIQAATEIINSGEIITSLSNESLAPGNSIVDMVRTMQNYILPPLMDFVKYPKDVTPFSMYIFEFEHYFTKDDLSYIWQNLTPPTGNKITFKTATIEHDLSADELMGVTGKTTSTPMQENTKWLVFKVKQKGVSNYYNKIDNQVSKFKSISFEKPSVSSLDYGFNWPYDYFSMIEMVKLDSEVEFSKDQEIAGNKK